MSRRTRPGADRITMRLINAAISTHADMLIMHAKQCTVCMRAGTDAMAHCGTWWDIKTELHKLQRQKGIATSDVIMGQQALPGMEPGQ